MAFFEAEFPRFIAFQRVGGQGFNTAISSIESGHEKRIGNWIEARSEYEASLITPQSQIGNFQQYVDAVRTFFFLVGGMHDPFRFYDHLDCQATNEPMQLVGGSVWQLQKTYTLFGRTYFRTITKPITASVIDYTGVALTNTVTVSGGTVSAIDHTTGQVTLSAITGSPTASFKYHIPVRFNTEKFDIEVEQSSSANPIIHWNGLHLIEALPPNY